VLSGYFSGPSAAAVGTHLPRRSATGRRGAADRAARDPLGRIVARTDVALPGLNGVVGAVHSCIRPSAALPARPAASRATPRLLRGA